jgi:Ion channel
MPLPDASVLPPTRYPDRHGALPLMSVLEIVAGVLIVFVTLWDAFETIVLPRTVQRRFRLTRAIVRGSWLPWSMFVRTRIGSPRRDSLLAFYGPLLLFLLLGVWAVGLVFGFGLILYGLGPEHLRANDGSPGLGTAIYLSGSTLFTLGIGDVTPASPTSRAVTTIEAGTGFGFLAMVISYLPIFYQAFSRREVAISLLDARAGSPPTAVELIRRNRERVAAELLAEWEVWASELLESHLSYPILAFFRSQHEKQSWLAALTVILDTSALIMTGVDGMPTQQARFTFAMARHALVDLTQIFFTSPTTPEPPRLPSEDFRSLSKRLEAAGFPLVDERAETELAAFRSGYEPFAFAISQRLMMDLPSWIPAKNAEDDWQSSPWDSMLPI